MNCLLSQSTIFCRHNVGHLRPSHATLPIFFHHCIRRLISTSQWKKYLTILDVSKTASTKDIKDSFLRLSKIYHPDNKITGSHTKFVELKEAYDALKDGHPSHTSEPARTNNYNNYYDTDISYQAHKNHRERYRDYETAYRQKNYGFGSPFKESERSWEDIRKHRMFKQQQAYNESFYNRGKGSSLVSITIVLSALAWIVIYSGVLLIWDYNDSVSRNMANYKAQNYKEYVAYQEYIKRVESARLGRLERIRLARANEYAKKNQINKPIQSSTVVELPELVSSDKETVSISMEALGEGQMEPQVVIDSL